MPRALRRYPVPVRWLLTEFLVREQGNSSNYSATCAIPGGLRGLRSVETRSVRGPFSALAPNPDGRPGAIRRRARREAGTQQGVAASGDTLLLSGPIVFPSRDHRPLFAATGRCAGRPSESDPPRAPDHPTGTGSQRRRCRPTVPDRPIGTGRPTAPDWNQHRTGSGKRGQRGGRARSLPDRVPRWETRHGPTRSSLRPGSRCRG